MSKENISLQKNVLISVVTVVLNDVEHFETTLQSIILQRECSLEYIVIDGGSTDGTLDIANRYLDKISCLRSEKDDGIYDAMNKGVATAKGDWVIFINSGDALYHPHVLRDIFRHVPDSADVLYGQYLVNYGNSCTRKALPRQITDMWKGIITSHQAILMRTEVVRAHPFNCNFQLAADHDLLSSLYISGRHFHYVAEVISVVSAAGISDTRRADVYREYAEISGQYFNDKPFRVYFLFKRFDCFLRMLAKRVMPKYVVEQLQTRKWCGVE